MYLSILATSSSKESILLRNFSKITHKKWELFVITRILHLLNDSEIEYVCQQYVNPSNSNKYYLTDLCFPSLKLYYEIDEGQHATKEHKKDDKIRQREILDATDWEQKRIRVYDKDDPSKGRDLNEVISEIDEFVNYIKNRKKEFESKKFSEYKDQFQWFLAIGLLFLFIEVFLFDTKTFWLKKLNLFNEN